MVTICWAELQTLGYVCYAFEGISDKKKYVQKIGNIKDAMYNFKRSYARP